MYLKQIVPPAQLPVSLAEARDHCRVLHAHDDPYLSALIATAAAHIEGRTGVTNRALVTQTWDWRFDEFPGERRYIELPLPPLQSVTSVKYLDHDGAEQTWDAANYGVDDGSLVGRIYLLPGKDWPSAQTVPLAVRIRFVCGYGGPDAVPLAVRHAILMLVGHWYVSREAAGEKMNTATQFAVEALLANHRIPSL